MSSHTFGDYARCFFIMLYIYLLKPYTEKVKNTFKGIDLIDRVPDELWMEVHDIGQETGIKTIPKKKMQKTKWLSGEALQIAVKRQEAKSKGERKDIPI